MTRFLTQQVINMGGSKITLMTRPTDDIAELAKRAPAVITEARTLLRRTSAQISVTVPDRVVKLARRYFLTGAFTIARNDLDAIKSVLVLIADGLASDVTIKVGSNVDFNGEVNSVPSTSTRAIKPYHNVATRLSTQQDRRYGAIKMADQRFQADLGVKTFIHEASHKYAGTIDYCYFDDDGVTPDSAFDDKSKALTNADSFAWFVLQVGRGWTG